MKIPQKFYWIFALIILIVATGLAQITLGNLVYLPVVLKDPTLTPTITPSPTLTPRPTLTPTPGGIKIIEVFQSKTENNPLDEYVSIHNYNSTAVSLTDWFIRDDGLHRYNFPNGYSIPSKQTIRIWTKDGINTTTDLYWGSPEEVWNDVQDCAYLRDNSDGDSKLIDVYCYKVTESGLLMIIPPPD